VTLRDCLRFLRSELGHSTSVVTGMNAEDALVATLERTQNRLWEEWDWPHLIVKRAIPLQAGQRYYNVPEDVSFERILCVEVRDADRWLTLSSGIDGKHYEVYDSDLGQRTYPPERYAVTEDPQDTGGNIDSRGMIEIWPIPDRNYNAETLDGTMRVHGVRTMRRFSQQSDRCELDHNLIVLHAAAEMLARQKSEDAQAKASAAQRLYQRLKGQGQKVRSFTLGEPAEEERWPVHPTFVTSRPS
jgi:hypothetical protein